MKRIFFAAIISGTAIIAAAQPLREVPPYMNIEVAEERLAAKDYYRALEYFEIAYRQERNDALEYKIAMLHYRLRDYNRAERWLRRVIERDQQGNYPDAVLAYARTMKKAGKYNDAIEAYNVYASMVNDEDLLHAVDVDVQGIRMAAKAEAPIELVVKNIGRRVNSSYTEFAPVMHPEGSLYFAAINSRELVLLDGKTDDYFAKIYTTSLSNRGEWENPRALPSTINREGFHTGNVCFTPQGDRMIFTRALTDGDDLAESVLYESHGGHGQWGAPQELTGVNGPWIATHPAVGYLLGNEVLIFSSDMEGGEGGFDLYYAERRGDGQYGRPVNMGPGINTPGDEITPYFRDNILYFSSNGHPGFGGFDFFFTEWDGTKWSDPENLGLGYNSGYDDMYFSANAEGTRGFIVSNRPDDDTRSVKAKTCCDDIFTFEIREIVVDLKVYTYSMDKQPLDEARVTLFEVIGNRPGTSTGKSSGEGNTTQFLLDFDKTYRATIEREGYFPADIELNTVGLIGTNTLEHEVFLEKAPATDDVRVITINEPIRLNKIYYDFDDDKILPDAEKDLETLLDLMDTYPDMVIELSSHTDAQGSDRYNERLSQRRAQSAVDWLISRGIDPSRLVAVGYGESRILNHCVNGVQCTDDEHRFNRRTEFKIIAGPTEIQVKKETLGDDPVQPTRRRSTGGRQSVRNEGIGLIQAQTTPKYRLSFDTLHIDFGPVRRGERREYTYGFENTGTKPVQIDIVTSCDCTILTWPEYRTFQPGDRGEIHAIFDSTEKEESETVDIDIILAQDDPRTGFPIVYTLKYSYDLVQ